MKIEHLETVLAVYRCQSLKKAADIIPCACSTVTKHIQYVEEEFQDGLFGTDMLQLICLLSYFLLFSAIAGFFRIRKEEK